jgi:hypothetical protein
MALCFYAIPIPVHRAVVIMIQINEILNDSDKRNTYFDALCRLAYYLFLA